MKILGIESSADETAAAIVEDGYRLSSNVVASSLDLHTAFGGIVPEIAARSHIESIILVIDKALKDAFQGETLKRAWEQIDGIAVTQGPGLIGSLLIGVLTARTLAIAKNKPLYSINHVQAHVYASFITGAGLNFKNQNSKFKFAEKAPEFPLLALIVSGGHTQIVLFKSHKKYKLLGQTTDDAVGEAFDKVAKMLGLPYPGGPSVAKLAQNGDPNRYKLPKAKMENPYDFSFSGLKTAVLRAAQTASGHDYTFPSVELSSALSEAQKADLAASFQATAVQTLVDGLKTAYEEFQPASVVIAGGVAANEELRKQASEMLSTLPTYSRDPDQRVGAVIYPDIKLCTDNAAMIAALAYYQIKGGQKPADPYSLEVLPSLTM